MPTDYPPDVRAALMEAMSDPFRVRVYSVIVERPGATVAQVAARIGEPARRVRHQIERLIAAGLLVADGQSARRNTRERHYRALVKPTIVEQGSDGWTDDERRTVALSILRYIVADIGGAMRRETFGTHPEHAEVRIPGEVDEAGWQELAQITLRAVREIEGAMLRSAARLRAEGRSGFEVISALLLFEAPSWGPDDGDREGPRPSLWLDGDPPAGA